MISRSLLVRRVRSFIGRRTFLSILIILRSIDLRDYSGRNDTSLEEHWRSDWRKWPDKYLQSEDSDSCNLSRIWPSPRWPFNFSSRPEGSRSRKTWKSSLTRRKSFRFMVEASLRFFGFLLFASQAVNSLLGINTLAFNAWESRVVDGRYVTCEDRNRSQPKSRVDIGAVKRSIIIFSDITFAS